MKKFSIVLLALLLAGGFAFAAEHATEIALDGEVSANFGLDFDAEQYGFYHDNTADFDLTWTAEGSSVGEGDVYGEISWTDVEISFDQSGTGSWVSDSGDLEAKIVGPDWEVLLRSPTSLGNAEAPLMGQDDDYDPEDAISLGFDNSPNDGEGLTLNYMGAHASLNYWNDGTTTFYAVSAGYSAEVADGVTVGGDLGMNENDFLGSITVGYVMDMVSVDAAVDFLLGDSTNDDLGFDASVGATLTPSDDLEAYLAAYYEASNEEFDLFAKATYTGVENTELVAWAYLNDSSNAFTAPAASDEESLEAWAVGVEAAYTVDIFTPYAEVGYDASEAFALKVGTGIAIIDNASIDVNYDNSDMANNTGALNASVTVSL